MSNNEDSTAGEISSVHVSLPRYWDRRSGGKRTRCLHTRLRLLRNEENGERRQNREKSNRRGGGQKAAAAASSLFYVHSCDLKMACARGKYRAKTLQEKSDILREVDAGLLSKQEIAEKCAIPKSTLSTYIKNKRAIEDTLAAEVANERKRMRPAKYPDLEKALLLWIKDMRAADIAQQLGYDDFAASAPAHTLRWLFISAERLLAWPVALGPLVVKMTTHDCRRGNLGKTLGIPSKGLLRWASTGSTSVLPDSTDAAVGGLMMGAASPLSGTRN
ncbi:hypothetical protein HPB47_009377 [Ixodes persulcatus]|uniref:Uncharacterized protein n=1 Tax=Ixodes persulcatus TaxID=34615 RepID=A0AC60P292_IXOPE|nr:hypothetical protein HPB47_009377 [Ixodes persulcatus]